MADKLIETIARWLCEERDPGIMLTDPGYWTRYKPEAAELIAAIDAAGFTIQADDQVRDEFGRTAQDRQDFYEAMIAATPQE